MNELTVAGFKWQDRGPGFDDHLGYAEDHEPHLVEFLSHQQGKVFVDVGAHVGRYTLRMSRKFDLVYAVEPGVVQREGLEANLKLNEIENVVILPFVAANNNGSVGWVDRLANSSVGVNKDGSWNPKPCFRLDYLVKTADWIKIDVEGHEVEVVLGTHNMGRPNFVIEVHDFLDPGIRNKLLVALRDYGYDFEWLPPYGQSGYLIARYSVG